ncbi:MAG: hypothetical protein JSW41_01250 [Candidatus Aenigmatarchaeota archaeon]|nr:MAG: hypothetical protein JSW41_01250 [Candidatus Aenigmarchaeota archaeon]
MCDKIIERFRERIEEIRSEPALRPTDQKMIKSYEKFIQDYEKSALDYEKFFRQTGKI